MAIKSGLVALVDSVRAYLDARFGPSERPVVALGWRERTKQINQGPGGANRVVFTPSDDNGRGGRIIGTQQPGARTFGTGQDKTTTRALFDWERTVIVSVWALDRTKPTDEAAQIEAVETLFEWVVRAVQQSAYANAKWTDVNWTVEPVEHAFGRELRAGLIFRHPLFDSENDVAFPTGVITKTLTGESG
jgi:hypothetical protein